MTTSEDLWAACVAATLELNRDLDRYLAEANGDVDQALQAVGGAADDCLDKLIATFSAIDPAHFLRMSIAALMNQASQVDAARTDEKAAEEKAQVLLNEQAAWVLDRYGAKTIEDLPDDPKSQLQFALQFEARDVHWVIEKMLEDRAGTELPFEEAILSAFDALMPSEHGHALRTALVHVLPGVVKKMRQEGRPVPVIP